MNNFVKTLRYSNPNSLKFRTLDSITDFANGQIALSTNFYNNASILVDLDQTPIRDCILCYPLPLHIPVLAGWHSLLQNIQITKKKHYAF